MGCRSPRCARKNPCSPAENAICTPSPAANAGPRNSPARSSGAGPSARRRVSSNPSTPSPPTPPASSTHTQAGQPSCRPSSSGYTIATSEAASSTAPVTSGRRAPGSSVSGKNRSPAISAHAATGTLTKNTARQLHPNRFASVSTPPSSSPTAEAKPSIAP